MRAAALLLAAVVGLVPALAGCGFTPLYAQGAAGTEASRIAVRTPDDRLGYRLREQLEDALAVNRGATPTRTLDVQVESARRPLGRRIDDTATRYELTVRAAWTLTSPDGGDPVGGVETATVTYAAADQPYAAIGAQQDGEDRAAADLARLLRVDILRALSGQ